MVATPTSPAQTAGVSEANSSTSSLLGQLLGQLAPQLQLGQGDIAMETGLMKLAPQLFGLQQSDLAAQYGEQMGQYGLQGQGLGLQQQYLTQQEQTAGKQYGIETAPGTGTFSLEQLQNQMTNNMAKLQTSGQAAASGSVGSVGQQVGTAQNSLQNFLNTQGLQNTEQQAALGRQSQLQQFGYQQGQQGISQQGLGLSEQMAGTQYGYQSTQNKIQGAQTQMQDLQSLLAAISGQTQGVTSAATGLGILQGMGGLGTGAQPNTGN